MTQIAVVYHSGTGRTKYQAQAVADGAKAAGADVSLISVEELEGEAHWSTLKGADAIIFGSPTYMGSVSAPFKVFMDASSKLWFDQVWANKIAAGFTNAGSLSGDKLNVLMQLSIFAAQHGMHWVNLGLLPNHKSGKEALNRMGGFLGAMAQSEQQADRPTEGDLNTAKHLGARVAEVAMKLAA